ncbi:MAG: TrkA family potassium uptake protein [Caldilineaceae bacterium]|nr:TrkA family potassium uptake protein [Caldilineaceae bacterium]
MKCILVGGGKTAYFLARDFISKGYEVALIVRNGEEATALSRQVRAPVLRGDGSNPLLLEDAGARQADVLLALTPHDEDNLVACQLAQRMYGVPRTIALVNDPENEEIFRQLGITVAVSATRIIATLIEEQTSFDDITNLFAVAEGRIMVTEVHLSADAPAVDKTLQALNLPEGALVAGIVREETTIVPRGTTRLQRSDRLILVAQPDNYGVLLRALIGEAV